MDTRTFNKVVKEQQELCNAVLIDKAAEYSTDDKLHNFKQAAHLQQCTQAQALTGMMGKHTVSVYDMVASGEDYSLAKWEEKITDHLNYLLLLKAIVVEEMTNAI